ncbi:MAG: hypothetical protein H6917_12850 [Novosphingobium sp.]|nr:hypothetical protein [Novosphingobium sp.]MCP5403258.1 hypothetical protein [Novosphingobium sp.]
MTPASPRLRADKRVRRKARRKPPGAAGAEPGNLPQYWRREFLSKLAETSNVTRSCEHAGVNPSTVYDLRRRDPGFAQRWLDALCEGYDNLEMEMLAHLRHGESAEPGARKFNYAVALRMLLAHRETVSRERARRINVEVAEVRSSIERKVSLMRERVLARKRREEAQASGSADE